MSSAHCQACSSCARWIPGTERAPPSRRAPGGQGECHPALPQATSVSTAPKVRHRCHSLELELRKLRMWPEPCESPWVFFSVHRGYPTQDDPGPTRGTEGRGAFAPSPSWLTPSSRRWLNSAHAKGASATTLISALVPLSILMHIPPWQLQPLALSVSLVVKHTSGVKS